MVGPGQSDVEERFATIRANLDAGGYLESLGPDSMRLVERLYFDLVQTTESLQKTLTEYAHFKKIADELEEGVAPFKEENVRLYKENSQLRMGIAQALEEAEDNARAPMSRVRELESENNDLKLLVSKFAERVKRAQLDSFEKTRRVANLQEKNLGSAIVIADRGKKVANPSRESMDYFATEACPQCIRLRNYVEFGKKGRNPKAIDYMKLADSRIEALQLQLRSFKNLEKENASLIESLKSRVSTRDAEIDKLRDLIKIRPGRDNKVNALIPYRGDKMENNLEIELKSAEVKLQFLQRRNLELEEKLKRSILQEHDDYMQGKISAHIGERNVLNVFLEKELDRYPSQDKMSLLEKLYYLERQLSHCCKEKASLQKKLEECHSKHVGVAFDKKAAIEEVYINGKMLKKSHGMILGKRSESSLVRNHASRQNYKASEKLGSQTKPTKDLGGSSEMKRQKAMSSSFEREKRASKNVKGADDPETILENEDASDLDSEAVQMEENSEPEHVEEKHCKQLAARRSRSLHTLESNRAVTARGRGRGPPQVSKARPSGIGLKQSKSAENYRQTHTQRKDYAYYGDNERLPSNKKTVADREKSVEFKIPKKNNEEEDYSSTEYLDSDDGESSNEIGTPEEDLERVLESELDRKNRQSGSKGGREFAKGSQSSQKHWPTIRTVKVKNSEASQVTAGLKKPTAGTRTGAAGVPKSTNAAAIEVQRLAGRHGTKLNLRVTKEISVGGNDLHVKTSSRKGETLTNRKNYHEVVEERDNLNISDGEEQQFEEDEFKDEELPLPQHQSSTKSNQDRSRRVQESQRDTQIHKQKQESRTQNQLNNNDVHRKPQTSKASQEKTHRQHQQQPATRGIPHSRGADIVGEDDDDDDDIDAGSVTGYYEDDDSFYFRQDPQPKQIESSEGTFSRDPRVPQKGSVPSGSKRLPQGNDFERENLRKQTPGEKGASQQKSQFLQRKEMSGEDAEPQSQRPRSVGGSNNHSLGDEQLSNSQPGFGDPGFLDPAGEGISAVHQPSLLSISEFEKDHSGTEIAVGRPQYGRQMLGTSEPEQHSRMAAEFGKEADVRKTGANNSQDSKGRQATAMSIPGPHRDTRPGDLRTDLADREFTRGAGGGVDTDPSVSEQSYPRRQENNGFSVNQRRGLGVDGSFEDKSKQGFQVRLPSTDATSRIAEENLHSRTFGNSLEDRNSAMSWAETRQDSHEKRALLDKIRSLQRKLDDQNAESSRHQLKSFELQGELERAKHLLQVEKQERELATSELKKLRDQSESTARMLMNSSKESEGSFRWGATPMEMEREIVNLRAALSSLDRDKDDMRAELDRKDEKLARLENESSKYLDEISQLKLRLKTSELQISHEGESAREQNRELEFLKKQLETNRRDFEKIIRERDDALKELHRISGAHAKGQMERRGVATELELKTKEADDLRRQVQRYVDEVRRIEELLLDKEEEMETLIQHYRALSTENNNLEHQRTNLEREASSIRESVRDAVDQNITFQRQLSSQNSLVQSFEEEIERLTQQVSRLENQLASKTEREKVLEADTKASKDLLHRVEVQMDKLKLELAHCDSKRKQLQAENEELNTHVAALDLRLQDECIRQQQLETLVANSRENDFELESKAQKISRERDELNEQLLNLEKRSESLKEEVAKYRLMSTKFETEIERLKRQVDSEKRDKESIVMELERVNRGLNSSSANMLLNTALGTSGSSGTSQLAVGGTQRHQISQSVPSFRQPSPLGWEGQSRGSREESPFNLNISQSTDLQMPTPIGSSTTRNPQEDESLGKSGESNFPEGASGGGGDDSFEPWDTPK